VRLYSGYIDALVRWLTSHGVTVHINSLPLLYSYDGVAGVYRSETKEIWVDRPEAYAALLTLAHEAGHWIGYEVMRERKHSYQRERQAFVYGWKVLQLLGAPITRKQWIDDERNSGNVSLINKHSLRRRHVWKIVHQLTGQV
jgi:hypothetical protein